MKILNRILFGAVLLVLLVMSLFSDSVYFFYGLDKPWQLNPFSHEDSLCNQYKTDYQILGRERVILKETDSLKSVVVILVDAWGVPLEPSSMKEDFDLFSKDRAMFALHPRLANRNTHAEGVEYFNNYEKSIYFFGGDSLEYEGRPFLKNRVKETLFCQNCGDEVMLAKLDSAITSFEADTAAAQPKMLAWTTQTSRDGNRENLHKTLAEIAQMVQKHPEMQFVIQGTHRPILGTPETRRMYHAHWVPVVVINATK